MVGFINILKPEGMSSAYAVGAVKKKFNVPCGHMGTLDPMASGVLPIGIGQASRLFPYMIEKEKEYVAEFTFGVLTDTLDSTGKTEKTTDFIPSKEQILQALPLFLGEIDQIPPMYSAKCIDGKRGYELARKGVEFELKPKRVEIKRFDLLEQVEVNKYKFIITCTGGTYIRSLARDLGEKCGSLAIMSGLERTQSGIFTTATGIKLEDFKAKSVEEISKYIIAPDTVVGYGKAVLTKKQAQKILDGVYENIGIKDGVYRVYNVDEFWGIGEAKDGILKIKSYVRDL